MVERIMSLVSEVRQDVAFATRTLLFTPAFAAAAVTLGVATGAVAAVYGTADWLLDRPPTGVVQPERVVDLNLGQLGRPDLPKYGFSYPQYLTLETTQDAFEEVAAYAKVSRMIGSETQAFEEVVTQWVSGSYFPLLGVQPHLGRLLTPEDDVDGAPALVVISHAYWQTRLGGSSDVIGATLRFGPDPVTVVGVLPPDFEDYRLDWNGPTHVWFPMRAAQSLYRMPGMLTMTQTFFRVLGRLPEGRTLEQASEMAQRWVPDLPALSMSVFEPNSIELRPASMMRIGRRDQAGSFLRALLTVCLLVLLAAAANVVNFLLGRLGRRRRELAVRAALGAGRARLGRQLLTEAALLASATALVAATAGWMVGRWLAPLPATYLDVPFRHGELTTAGAIDADMFGLALVAGGVVTLILGTLPALGTFHDPARELRGAGPRWGWSRFRLSGRQLVLTCQIGFAVLLAASAALFGRSFAEAISLPREYGDPSTLLLARTQPVSLPDEEAVTFLQTLLARLEEEPGVHAATVSWNPPYAGAEGAFAIPASDQRPLTVPGATGGPHYFAVQGTSIVTGEDFGAVDDPQAGEDLIINEAFAERFWPGQDPVDRAILHNDVRKRIRAVVDRRRCESALGPATPCYWSWAGVDRAGPRVYRVRTVGPAHAFVPRFREIVAELSPEVAVTSAESLEAFLGYQVRAERFAAFSSIGLALFGILLLAGGCASVFVSMVRQSVREIAIRIALGATERRLARRILGHGALLMASGVGIGLLATRLVAPHFADRLFQVSPTDPASYTVAAVVIAAVALSAVGVSTRVAAATDPSRHLKGE
jgi:predicted permease